MSISKRSEDPDRTPTRKFRHATVPLRGAADLKADASAAGPCLFRTSGRCKEKVVSAGGRSKKKEALAGPRVSQEGSGA